MRADRHARGLTIVTSQLPLELWHETIGLATGLRKRRPHRPRFRLTGPFLVSG